MVGLVLVSHSGPLANSLADLSKLMAPDAPVFAAGGLEDGSFGTSYEAIMNACNQADTGDGAIVLMDMGSSVMTAEMVLEDLDNPRLVMADAPMLEGAIAAAVKAANGGTLEEVLADAKNACASPKF